MNDMSSDFVLAVIGQQALELAALRVKVAQLEAQLKPKPPEQADNVVPLSPLAPVPGEPSSA